MSVTTPTTTTGTVTYDELAAAFLDRLGAPKTTGTVRAVAIWFRHESGGTITNNNPANLRDYGAKYGGIIGRDGGNTVGSPGFIAFATPQDGARAAADLIGSSSHYTAVAAALRAGNAAQALVALAKSPWSADHYGIASGVDSLTKLFTSSTSTGTASFGHFRSSTTFTGSPSPATTAPVSASTTSDHAKTNGLDLSGVPILGPVIDGIGAAGAAATGLVSVLAFLLDPKQWARMIVALLGVVLVAVGFFIVINASRG